MRLYREDGQVLPGLQIRKRVELKNPFAKTTIQWDGGFRLVSFIIDDVYVRDISCTLVHYHRDKDHYARLA
jgi:hypothetical protein